jgi:membrane-bound inhibitor of C-type lysozyme
MFKKTALIGLLALAACSEKPLPAIEYICEDKAAVKAEFHDSYAMVAFAGEDKAEKLDQVISASGAKYEKKIDGISKVFWSKGDKAMVNPGTGKWVECEVAK